MQEWGQEGSEAEKEEGQLPGEVGPAGCGGLWDVPGRMCETTESQGKWSSVTEVGICRGGGPWGRWAIYLLIPCLSLALPMGHKPSQFLGGPPLPRWVGLGCWGGCGRGPWSSGSIGNVRSWGDSHTAQGFTTRGPVWAVAGGVHVPSGGGGGGGGGCRWGYMHNPFTKFSRIPPISSCPLPGN